MRILNKFTTSILALTVGSAMATAEPTFFMKPDGGYETLAKATQQRLAQRGHTINIEGANGSDAITLAACREDMTDNGIWVAQLDAVWKREIEGCYLESLTSYHTMEYGFLFYHPDNVRNMDLHDLTANHNVAVDTIGSGSEFTFKNWQFIEKEFGRGDAWSDAKPIFADPRRVTAMSKQGKVHMTFLVDIPSAQRLGRLIDQGWIPVKRVTDKDINDQMNGATPLYVRSDWVELCGIKDTNNCHWTKTYEVPSAVGVSENFIEANEEIYNSLLNVLSE